MNLTNADFSAADRVRTVLLVEDDRFTSEMLRMALEDAGYSVLAAGDVASLDRKSVV